MGLDVRATNECPLVELYTGSLDQAANTIKIDPLAVSSSCYSSINSLKHAFISTRLNFDICHVRQQPL